MRNIKKSVHPNPPQKKLKQHHKTAINPMKTTAIKCHPGQATFKQQNHIKRRWNGGKRPKTKEKKEAQKETKVMARRTQERHLKKEEKPTKQPR